MIWNFLVFTLMRGSFVKIIELISKTFKELIGQLGQLNSNNNEKIVTKSPAQT